MSSSDSLLFVAWARAGPTKLSVRSKSQIHRIIVRSIHSSWRRSSWRCEPLNARSTKSLDQPPGLHHLLFRNETHVVRREPPFSIHLDINIRKSSGAIGDVALIFERCGAYAIQDHCASKHVKTNIISSKGKKFNFTRLKFRDDLIF